MSDDKPWNEKLATMVLEVHWETEESVWRLQRRTQSPEQCYELADAMTKVANLLRKYGDETLIYGEPVEIKAD